MPEQAAMPLDVHTRSLREQWESLYVRLANEGWTINRYHGNAVTNDEQSVTLVFKRKEPSTHA